MRKQRSRLAPVLVLALAVAFLVSPLGPSAAVAADCSGRLHAQMNFVVASQGRIDPPAGLDYATQPPADLWASDSEHGIVVAQRDQGCVVAGAAASVSARDLGQRTFSTRRTGTTNSSGYLAFGVVPPRTTDLKGRVAVGDESAETPARRFTVRPFVRGRFSSAPGCVLHADGTTYPAKPHHPVWLQRRITKNGTERGYLTLQRAMTDAQGKFRISYRTPCGADYALAAYLPASGTNTAGRTLYVDLHVVAHR
jgi:hypothetical protein